MRITHLDVVDVSLFSEGDYLTKLKSFDFNAEVLTQPGRAISQRHQLAIPTKKKFEFSGEEVVTSGGIRQTNLDVTLFTVGGLALLGRYRSGSLKITTDVDEGSGGADEWEFPVANGTDTEITGEFQIASAAELAALVATAGIDDVLVVAQLAFGGMTYSQPMTLTMAGHSSKEGANQTEKATLKSRGLPTTASGHSILASIALGTAQVDWVVDTGAGSYSGTAIFTQADFQFNNNAIQTCAFTLANCGTPTIE